MNRPLITLWVMFGSLSAGYAYQMLVRRRRPEREGEIPRLAAALQRLVVTTITPLTLLSAFWALSISGGAMAFFPLVGALSHVIGVASALAASRFLGLDRKSTGSMLTCGAFTNLGSIGGLVAFMLYGEPGYALAGLFRVFEPMLYFMVGFPLAKTYAQEPSEENRLRVDPRAIVRDRLILLPILGVAAGGVLNLSGLARPVAIGEVNPYLILASTTGMLFAVGLNMRPAAARAYVRESAAIAGIKYVVLPAGLTLLALMLGYGRIDGGLPLKVVITMSAMPVAFNSLVPPSLYGLNKDLANSCWLVSMGLLVVVLPLLSLVREI